jgi:glycosyltransferase involved in cell wall biosynthesis
MKVYFIFEFTNEPKGGVFQFTKALESYFSKQGCVTDVPEEADVFFMSAFQFTDKIVNLKKQFPNKIFVHRIDGPIRLYNRLSDKRDLVVNILNKYIGDGTVFQSSWSKEKSLKMGLENNHFETTIINAPNSYIFNKNGKKTFNKNEKIKLIATSWSSNIKKGFEVYKWIDENLDFNKYEMTFVGNSPFKFKNIILKDPMDSKTLASELKRHDIFITASQSDPCSNSLIEAMHCGLPALGLDDGGHTEIIAQGGEVFKVHSEIPQKLDLIVNNYEEYQNNINLPTIDEVGELYFQFLKRIYDEKAGSYKPKNPTSFDYLKIRSYVVLWNLEEKLYAIKRRIFK